MNCLGYKQSVEEGRLNNKDKVFIKIKGLYTGTMDEEASFDGEEAEVIESQDDEVEVKCWHILGCQWQGIYTV